MTKIKICGITNIEDAHVCVEAGADALGFVFYKGSPRYVEPKTAFEIIRSLPPFISSVGLFVNHSHEEVHAILHTVPLSVVQFHGNETPDFIGKYRKPCIKAFRVSETFSANDIVEYAGTISAALLDAFEKDKYGGTGNPFQWEVLRKLEADVPIIVAGGLNPDNIAGLLENFSPYGVDVSSGVESAPGKKDPAKVRDFIVACR